MWPHCDPGDPEQTAALKDRFATGPWGSINVPATTSNFARNLVRVFLVYFLTMWATAIVVGMGQRPMQASVPCSGPAPSWQARSSPSPVSRRDLPRETDSLPADGLH